MISREIFLHGQLLIKNKNKGGVEGVSPPPRQEMKSFIKYYTSQIAVWALVILLMGIAGYLPDRFFILILSNIVLVSPFLFSEKAMTCLAYVKSIFSKHGLIKISISIDIALIVVSLVVCTNTIAGYYKGLFDINDIMYFLFLILFLYLFYRNFKRYLMYHLNKEDFVIALLATLAAWILREVHHEYFYLLESFRSYFIDMGLKTFNLGSFIFALNSVFKFKKETI
ncbi:hypothetical protein SAMN05660337_0451 [Maridesulfovibrio ferrireducens]|uniref:Uncharacterized protein n=1 Tax=Maridesulfovibrio ferrireducens TaxID=246191 RepID=A0A1G9BY76_9BACT|nr:hypothetical protein [Maridesulfovibrio ferrireducens]SDK43895.1 hypothetical protein SAMN05660337_0451 [Maridesulfovibrio ferrireducens]